MINLNDIANEELELNASEVVLEAGITAESKAAADLEIALEGVRQAQSALREALYAAAGAAYKAGNKELQKSIYAQIDVVVAL